MGTPDMNPLAARLMGGAEARTRLKAQLEAAAAATEDPAYRARLLEIADGRRPLRTLMSDPGFIDQIGMRAPGAEADLRTLFARRLAEAREDPDSPWNGTPEEIQARVRDRLAAQGVQVPGLEELKALFPDVSALREHAEGVVRAEELNAWGGTVERLAARDRGTDRG